jgi:hypothetical protein
MGRRTLVVALVPAILGGLLIAEPASALKRPHIVRAVMGDADRDDRADRVTLTYNEQLSYPGDSDGTYPFAVSGFTVRSVKAAVGKKIIVVLREPAAPDIAATPTVTYTRTTDQPVTDHNGIQARSQTFSTTIPLDADGDGFTVADGDCGPTDPSVHPGAADPLDPAFVDSNCDGIDGDAAHAVTVASAGGVDGAGCGSIASPCASITFGIQRAATAAKPDVYVAGGSYGPFAMVGGISVHGGFGQNFQRDPALATGSQTATITASVNTLLGSSQAVAVVADGLTQAATLGDFTLVGVKPTASGASSYVVVVRNVAAGVLTISGNVVTAANGAPGRNGDPGVDANPVGRTDVMNGISGGAADRFATFCDSTSRGAGGAGGTNPAVTSGQSVEAGRGGAGGTMDTVCTVPRNFTATDGQHGADAQATQSAAGKGGTAGAGSTSCGGGGDGHDGFVTDGGGGLGVAPGGHLDGSGLWVANSSGSGLVGQNGGGGGGGGGSGGCDSGTDSYGAGGGGGGAGGARAVSGGGGGGGGGSSFGIYLFNATPEISANTITGGSGGNGGLGGLGGQGQAGGLGGAGGLAAGGSKAGGDGGDGAHGGHSGGGAGGDGGSSYAVFASGTSSLSLTSNVISTGSAGLGAPGGASSGNAGQAGVNGVANTIGVCAAAGAC